MASGASKKSESGDSEMVFKHKTFRRSYREDYARELEVPGVGQHIFLSFRMIFSNFKVLFPVVLIVTIFTSAMLGVVSFGTLADAAAMVTSAFSIIAVWLMTIFVIRNAEAGEKVRLSDALFKSMAPMNSVLVLLIIAAVQIVPVILVIVAYSSAVETHFLDTPFYAFLFLTFAVLMFLLTGYLLSSTTMAMVAVCEPGVYPFSAIKDSNEMMISRRMRFMVRLVALLIVVVIMWVLVGWPVISFVPNSYIVSFIIVLLSCISVMYIATYFYLYYKWMRKFDKKSETRSSAKNKEEK